MIPTPKILFDDEVQAKVKEAATILYKVAKTAYGPASKNVVIGFRHGPPLLSHDGIMNIKLVRDSDPHVADLIEAIKSTSEKNNHKVGDGTTAVIILTYHLLMEAQKMLANGLTHKEIAAKLNELLDKGLTYLTSVKQPLNDKTFLEKIAKVSASDDNLGMMVADVMNEVGKDGGVVIETYEGVGIHPEIVDGFYINSGFKDPDLINDKSSNQSQHQEVAVLICNKRLMTNVDLGPIVEPLSHTDIKEILLIADCGPEVLETLRMTKLKGHFLMVPVDVPVVAGARSLMLDDLSLLTGATVYEGGDFKPEIYLGSAREVLVTNYSTTIIGGDSDSEKVKERIKELRKQTTEDDHYQSLQFAKDRLARLHGKMAIIRVGGALEFEREEVKLRVQDAVCAVQSTLRGGYLPGGGVTFTRISGTAFDEALKEPFRQLFTNAGLNPERYLALLPTDFQMGFNLNRLTDEPIDLIDEGIVDPYLVQTEILTNAVSITKGLISAGAHIAQVEKE